MFKHFIIICYASILLGLTQNLWAFQNIEQPKTKWRFKTQGPIRGTAIILNNHIYFGSADGYIYALNKETGDLIWKYKTEGALMSAPVISNSSLFISSRDHYLYSINMDDGRLNWKFKMQVDIPENTGSWKYFMASPVIINDQVLIGSGDSHLYSLNINDGTVTWKFKTNGRIRATPQVYKDTIYQPSNDGHVYALNLNGRLLWKFETLGASYNSQDYGFDRITIVAQPLIKDNSLIIASKDGNTYSINLTTLKVNWKFNYNTTWAVSVNVSDDMVFVGWSTNNLFSALDFNTGKEKWQFKSHSHNYTKALITDSSIYIGSADGKIYKLNKFTGQKQWEYIIGNEIFSSLISDAQTIYFGADDGYLYALEEGAKSYKAVYDPVNDENYIGYLSASNKIVPYLVKKDFEHINSEARLLKFITKRLKDKAPSVIVFSYLIIPDNLIGDFPDQGLFRQYLDEGGKILWMGDVPNYYGFDASGNQTRSSIKASKLLDVTFENPEESGNYYSLTTQKGQNMGLPLWLKTTNKSVIKTDIIPLAFDEFNRASIWMKKYNPRIGSGFLSSRTWSWNVEATDNDLDIIYQLAIYGLE